MIDKNLFLENKIQKRYLRKKIINRFNKKCSSILQNLMVNFDKPNQTLNTLSKKFKLNFNLKDLKKFQKFNTLVIVGMGGSILGTEAIYEFLKQKIKKKVYFIDNIDQNKILDLKKKIIPKKTLFIIISKSGNTIETFSNFLSFNIIKKNSKNIIIISESRNNLLYNISKKFNLFHISHKSFIGGRYSVLSEVGMVPAHLMGLNIRKFRIDLIKNLSKKRKVFLRDSSIKLANLLHDKKIRNLILLNYAPNLEKFLFWYQQLTAESLGKKDFGFLPTISNTPKDHHSLLQLYLDGPKDKLFYIFSVKEKSFQPINTKKYSNKVNYLHNKNLIKIKDAQKNALIKSLIKKDIPYREFIINNFNEETLAELFSYFILETIIIGKLVNINPYNQPAVEEVKLLTKKLLG